MTTPAIQPAKTIIGIGCRTSNAPDAAPIDIPELWNKFYSENIVDRIPNKVGYEIIALYCDYDGDHTQPYSVVIGCEVNSTQNIPQGMVARTLPKGHYIKYLAVGEFPQSLIEAWGQIWHTDLKRTYTGDYEVYGDKFVNGTPKEVEIYIAVEKA